MDYPRSDQEIETDSIKYQVFSEKYLEDAATSPDDPIIRASTARVYWEMVNTSPEHVLREVDAASGFSLGKMPVVEQFRLYRAAHDEYIRTSMSSRMVLCDEAALSDLNQGTDDNGIDEAVVANDWKVCQLANRVPEAERTTAPVTGEQKYSLAKFCKFRVEEGLRSNISIGRKQMAFRAIANVEDDSLRECMKADLDRYLWYGCYHSR